MHKKILFTITSLSGGGAERTISNLTTNFPPEWEIDILIARKDGTIYPYRGNIIDLGIKEQKNYNNLLYRIKVFHKKIAMLRKLKRQNRYTACISFMTRSNVANVLSGNRHCKTIVSIRNDSRHGRTSMSRRIAETIESCLNKKADLVVSISNGVREYLIKYMGLPSNKVKTIYNGYDIKNYVTDEPISAMDITNKPFTFITAGRLTSQKNQWHLIRAFAGLVKQHSDCKLVILGEGELRPYLEKLVREFGIEENVYLLGFVENTFDYYRQASAFIFTSLWEGFGNVIIEAMMCGLPIISTDCYSGPREILAPNTEVGYQNNDGIEYADYGILVPTCSSTRHSANAPLEPQEQTLLSAMEKIMADDKMRKHYAEMSGQRAEDFAIETAVDMWIETINEL